MNYILFKKAFPSSNLLLLGRSLHNADMLCTEQGEKYRTDKINKY